MGGRENGVKMELSLALQTIHGPIPRLQGQPNLGSRRLLSSAAGGRRGGREKAGWENRSHRERRRAPPPNPPAGGPFPRRRPWDSSTFTRAPHTRLQSPKSKLACGPNYETDSTIKGSSRQSSGLSALERFLSARFDTN